MDYTKELTQNIEWRKKSLEEISLRHGESYDFSKALKLAIKHEEKCLLEYESLSEKDKLIYGLVRNLCYYDPRNPEGEYDVECQYDVKDADDYDCACDACHRGKHIMAHSVLKYLDNSS